MQAKKSKAIEQPPIPQTMKALPRFIFLTYPWYWIKRMYRSKHFRQFLVICMACILAVSLFLTIFLAYDNAQLRRYCLPHICAKKINDIAMIEAVAYVTMLLFADNRDAATAMSKSCGGGESSSESGWGKKEDLDDWKFAHRHILMTHSMCKPKPRYRFHR